VGHSKEFRSFEDLVDRALRMDRKTLQDRLAVYRESSSKRKKRPGPKPKSSSASGRDGGD
jgi:hypothetical protein